MQPRNDNTQAKFAYFLFGEALEKQTKTVDIQGRKQINAIINKKEREAGLSNDKIIFEKRKKTSLL